jgi:hypothetical protein
MLRKLCQFTAALALLVATTGGLMASATTAQAAPRACGDEGGHALLQDPLRLYAYLDFSCNGKLTPVEMTISQLNSSGKWVIVASGDGTATYTCNGTTVREYNADVNNFDEPCG